MRPPATARRQPELLDHGARSQAHNGHVRTLGRMWWRVERQQQRGDPGPAFSVPRTAASGSPALVQEKEPAPPPPAPDIVRPIPPRGLPGGLDRQSAPPPGQRPASRPAGPRLACGAPRHSPTPPCQHEQPQGTKVIRVPMVGTSRRSAGTHRRSRRWIGHRCARQRRRTCGRLAKQAHDKGRHRTQQNHGHRQQQDAHERNPGDKIRPAVAVPPKLKGRRIRYCAHRQPGPAQDGVQRLRMRGAIGPAPPEEVAGREAEEDQSDERRPHQVGGAVKGAYQTGGRQLYAEGDQS